MKNIKKNISLLFLFFTLVSSLVYGQNKVPNLQDLIGVKGSSAEYELQQRGYKHINTSKTDYDSYSNWWHEVSKKCVSIRVSNGRVKSAVYAPAFDCEKSNNKSSKKQHDYNSYNSKYYQKHQYDNHYYSNNGSKYIIRSNETGLVLDANAHNSKAVSIWQQHGGANQKWIIGHNGNAVSIRNVANGRALTASRSSRNGELVSMEPWNNNDTQMWYLERQRDGKYYIVSKTNGKVLDVNSGNHNLTTWEKNGSVHQKWILEKTY